MVSKTVYTSAHTLRRFSLVMVLMIAAMPLMLSSCRKAPGTQPAPKPGELNIKFVGIRPYGTNDIYDAKGEKLDIDLPVQLLRRPPRTGQIGGTFIFELPDTDEKLKFNTILRIGVSGTDRGLGSSHQQSIVWHNGKRFLLAGLQFDSTYRDHSFFGFSSDDEDVEAVDLKLDYFFGPMQKPIFLFEGPFDYDKEYNPKNGQCKLIFTGETYSGVQFNISTSTLFDSNAVVIGYDKSGKRHFIRSSSFSSSSATGVSAKYQLQGTDISQITRITIAEQPHTVAVNNINVYFPKLFKKGHPEYLDEMAKRLDLNLSPDKLYQYSFKTSTEAIEVLDIVEGEHIRYAYQAISGREPRVSIKYLDKDKQELIHNTAKKWADSANPYVSIYGARLGLMGRWPEFIEPTLQIFEKERQGKFYSRQSLNQRNYMIRDVASSLQRSGIKLTDEQVERVKQIIFTTDVPRVSQNLTFFLSKTISESSCKTFKEIALDPRPWIWWYGMQVWQNCDKEYFKDFDALPEDIKLRRILIATHTEDPKLKALVAEKLPGILSIELLIKDAGAWSRIYEKIPKFIDRKTATKVIVDFMRQLIDEENIGIWWQEEHSGFRDFTHGRVFVMVRDINTWYGKDFGGLKTQRFDDDHKVEPKTFRDMKKLITDVIDWHDSNPDTETVEFIISATIVDVSGKGIEGAIITPKIGIPSDEKHIKLAQTTTDADGKFAILTTPEITRYDISVKAEGFMNKSLFAHRRSNGSYRFSNQNMVLYRPQTVSGRIIDADGTPLTNASFSGYVRNDQQRIKDYKTDDKGNFTIRGAPAGYHIISYAKTRSIETPERRRHRLPCEYLGPAGAKSFLVKEGEPLDDIVLDLRESTSTLELTVLDGDDVPVKEKVEISVSVQVPLGENRKINNGLFTIRSVSKNGKFKFENLPSLKGNVSVLCGKLFHTRNYEKIELIPGQTIKCTVKFTDKVQSQ